MFLAVTHDIEPPRPPGSTAAQAIGWHLKSLEIAGEPPAGGRIQPIGAAQTSATTVFAGPTRVGDQAVFGEGQREIGLVQLYRCTGGIVEASAKCVRAVLARMCAPAADLDFEIDPVSGSGVESVCT